MDAREVLDRICNMIDSGDFSEAGVLIADDFVDHGGPQGDLHGREGFTRLVSMIRSALTDYHYVADLVVVDGEMVAWRGTASGVHTGPLMGIPPTGKAVTLVSFNFGRVREGRAVERWGVVDTARLMAQLGAGPKDQG